MKKCLFIALAVFAGICLAGNAIAAVAASDDTAGVLEEGTLKWSFAGENGAKRFSSSPAIGNDGTIYVGCFDRNLYAINPDGTQKWAFKTGDVITSSPAIGTDGTIYAGSLDRSFYAINPDGTKKWSLYTSEEILSSPAIANDGTVYIGDNRHYLYAINPDGTPKWAFEAGWVTSSPAIGTDGTIYVTGDDGNSNCDLYAINPDGTEKWSYDLRGGCAGGVFTDDSLKSSPAIGSDGTVYIGNSVYLYAINSDGSERWTFKTGGSVISSPAIDSDGTIYIGSDDKYFFAINADGSLKWNFRFEYGIQSSPAIGSDGIIYIGVGPLSGSRGYSIHGINPDGTMKWETRLGDFVSISSPVIGSDGMIYVGGYSTGLCAVSSSSMGPADSPWPMFRHDASHTGRSSEGSQPVDAEKGHTITTDLSIGAVIHTEEKGQIDAVWQKGGEDTTADGHQVIWGYFYASPSDVTWGSKQNPDLFVKIWFDAGGRVDVNFFHVSVPNIDVYASYKGVRLEGGTTMKKRYVRLYYNQDGQDGIDENYEDGVPASGYSPAGKPKAYSTINSLGIGAVINTVDGPIDGVWQKGGSAATEGGHEVLWGHFYASPNQVSWGSKNNPDLFVKIWFDASGRIDVNFFHVSVPDIEVYSDYPSDGIFNKKGTTIMPDRYIRHEYNSVSAETSAEELNVSGRWRETKTVDARNCGLGIYTETNTISMTQNGSTVKVSDEYDLSGTGTLNGTRLSATVTWTEDDGIVTADTDLTFSDADHFSGSASWTWSDGHEQCAGTFEISGTRY